MRDPAGKMYYGNHLFANTESHSDHPEKDAVNNVERAVVKSPPEGLFVVRVVGSNVETEMTFSLVVTGIFDIQPSCLWLSCPNDCSGHGSCVRGACQCAQMYYGLDCSLEMPRLVSGVPFALSVSNYRWSFYAFRLVSASSWSLSISGSGQPNFYVAYNRLPSLVEHDWSDVEDGASASFEASSSAGLYILGVHAYCCDPAKATAILSVEEGLLVAQVCGNAVLESGEECDDSNVMTGDGCSTLCKVEM